MKIDISKKYLRKVNTIEVCSTMTGQDCGIRSFRDARFHILVDPAGGRYYLNPFEKALTEETDQVTITIAYIGGLDKKQKAADTRNDMQKFALVNAVREAVYWMYCERLDLTDLKIIGNNIGFNPEKEYGKIILSEGYKVKGLCV
jgi:hypothetical protein